MPSDVMLNVHVFPNNDLDEGEDQRVIWAIGGAIGAGQSCGQGIADRGHFFHWWLSPNEAIRHSAS